MSRLYALTFQNVAVTAAVDFFEVQPADDKPVRLHGVCIGQSTEAGDAQDEMLRWAVLRGFTTSGSAGGTASVKPLAPGDAAASFTGEVVNTTLATTGTPDVLHADCFNVRAGLQFWWTPECRPVCTQAQTLIVVRLVAAPADSITFDGTLLVEEL
jgi:hypothetical protein